MKIAIQGHPGSFHYAVAEEYFGASQHEIVCLDTFVAEANVLLEHKADVAVIAIENSIAGSILPNYNILQNRELKVVGESCTPIEQCLLVMPGVTIDEIQSVSSHPMALLQCEQYLDRFPWRRIQSEDTAFSAHEVATNAIRSASAIASAASATLYGLEILARDINTIHNNFTRFLIVTRADRSDFDCLAPNKASMFFQVSHAKGSLGKVLKIIELYDLNMSKLQSYPIPEDPFRYNFHLDVDFDDKASFEAAKLLMERHTEEFVVYGIYQNGNK